MIYKISLLLDDLRRNKVLGRSSDAFSFDLMWKCKNAVLLRFMSVLKPLDLWVFVERTGKQYYKVKVLRSLYDYDYTLSAHFRNSPQTTDYIKSLL